PAFKDAMKGLSLAWVVKSEFFSVQATYTATATNATLNSSSTREFGKLRVAVGSGDATEIDVTGPKSIYYLNNSAQNYTASFDAITLLQVSGTFEGERVTPFSSESDNTGGTATVGGLVETLNVNIFYSVTLIIISYPVWDGLDIVHDPDYTVAYAPNPVTPAPTPTPTTPTDTGQSTTTSTDSTTTKETTTSKTAPPSSTSKDEGGSDASSLPGFGFYIVAVSIALMVFRRRK
ncbi:MAG: hypothetical protein ACC656_02575, partial [Candidatus Heimdallarchaeota archaeon]